MRIEKRITDNFSTLDAVFHIVNGRQLSASEIELQIFNCSLVEVTRLKVLHMKDRWNMLL